MGRRKEIIQMHQKAQSKRNPLLLLALALLVLAVAVGGTIAWLTASNHVTNTFTVGQITQPDPGDGEGEKPETPCNPGNSACPTDPSTNPEEDADAHLIGNIYEYFPQNDRKIIPGERNTKVPYIGLGGNSEDSYIFAYVDNKMYSTSAIAADKPYFELNEGWAPVEGEGQVEQYNGEPDKYVRGLFMWVADGTEATPLASKKGDNADAVWTNPVFTETVAPENAEASDFSETPTMDVYCFIYANVNNTTPQAAKEAARTWVQQKMPASQGTAGDAI